MKVKRATLYLHGDDGPHAVGDLTDVEVRFLPPEGRDQRAGARLDPPASPPRHEFDLVHGWAPSPGLALELQRLDPAWAADLARGLLVAVHQHAERGAALLEWDLAQRANHEHDRRLLEEDLCRYSYAARCGRGGERC